MTDELSYLSNFRPKLTHFVNLTIFVNYDFTRKGPPKLTKSVKLALWYAPLTTAVAELLTCANLRGNFKFFKQRVGPKKTSQDSHHVNLATLVLTHTYRLYNVHTKRLKMKSPKVRFVESAKITQHLLLALLLHTYETVCESEICLPITC